MLKKRLVFDPKGSDVVTDRKIVGGMSTGIANLNSVKFSWASKLYQIMLNNHWIPSKVSLVDDRTTIKELTPDEMESLKMTLSFLIALDSMQTANIPYLSAYITAPEINTLLTLQAFQEDIHSQSYQYLLQELFPSVEREEIYNYWRTCPELLERNTKIANKYQEFVDKPTTENFKKALAADLVLEGIFFYNGFQFFYQLAARNKLTEVAKMILYIQNDEATHVTLVTNIIREVFDKNNKDDVKILEDAIREGVETETAWSQFAYGNRILGMSEKSSADNSKFLGNKVSKLAGIGVLYKGYNVDPYSHLDKTTKRENFFETTVTEYSQSSAVDGWDDF